MRLDKLLLETGYGSRNQVKKLIKSKQVLVDGKLVLTDNANVDPAIQCIEVAGKVISYDAHVYYMLHKPAGVVSAVTDWENPTVIDLIVPEDKRAKLFPVGRLDKDTEGLLLLTDNGQLGYQLLQPKKDIVKRYEVVVNGKVDEEDLLAFEKGIVFHGGIVCKPAKLTILNSSELESRVYLDIREGKFHQVKKMFLAVGKKVVYLKRLSMGGLQLDPNLKVGAYRSLNEDEKIQMKSHFKAHQKE